MKKRKWMAGLVALCFCACDGWADSSESATSCIVDTMVELGETVVELDDLVISTETALVGRGGVVYVSLKGRHKAPFDTLEKAATNIQAAVSSVRDGQTVLVDSGYYRPPSTIRVDRDIVIQSIDGSQATFVGGGGAHRCFDLGRSASVLSGFTITGGFSSADGGGILCDDPTPIVMNCVILANGSEGRGGGMFEGTAYHCIFVRNAAMGNGGGKYRGMAHGCVFISNTAGKGGGMHGGILYNCTLFQNLAILKGGGTCKSTVLNSIAVDNVAATGNNLSDTHAESSCAPELMDGIDGNISTDPQFVDAFNGDLRLSNGSPCIGRGDNAAVTTLVDIGGDPRIQCATVEMGAYEACLLQ